MSNMDWDYDSKNQPGTADKPEQTELAMALTLEERPEPAETEQTSDLPTRIFGMMTSMMEVMRGLSTEIRTQRNNDALSLTSLKRMENNVRHASSLNVRNTYLMGAVMLAFMVFTGLAMYKLQTILRAGNGGVDQEQLLLKITEQNEVLRNNLGDALLHNGEAIVDSVSTINEVEKTNSNNLNTHINQKFGEVLARIDNLPSKIKWQGGSAGGCKTIRHRHRSRPYWHTHCKAR